MFTCVDFFVGEWGIGKTDILPNCHTDILLKKKGMGNTEILTY